VDASKLAYFDSNSVL